MIHATYSHHVTTSANPAFTGACRGVAMEFGTVSKLIQPLDASVPKSNFLVLPGAMDKFLARLEAGRERVSLCVAHSERCELCSTDNGALKVFIRDSLLCFKVRSTVKSGRQAIRLARGFGYRQASPLLWITDYFTRDDGVVVIRESGLSEISLVHAGAFPGTLAFIS